MNCFRKIVVVAFFVGLASGSMKAQLLSYESLFYPSTSTMYLDASCFGYHYNNRSTYYMRYNDSSYLCSALNDALLIPVPTSQKLVLPQSFAISDFKKFLALQGYIGSYQGVGMFGVINNIDVLSANMSLYTYKLPAVDQLNRMAVCYSLTSTPIKTKAFAIGSKSVPSTIHSQSYIMEFYAEGVGPAAPYSYAPLAFDTLSGEKEIADDVITLPDNVIFATRDTRGGQTLPVLRISDTTNVLANYYIDLQWRFVLPSYEILSSKLRLIALDNEHFVLAYVIFNSKKNQYFLNTHRIYLPDFLSGNNSIVTHEVKITKECSELTDIIYEPDVKTMVILLNGVGKSELYHDDPFSNTNTYMYKLDYPNGNFYSIDTIGYYFGGNEDKYVAIGGNEIFCQEISSGFVIDNSCLSISTRESLLKESPTIKVIEDPINRYSDTRIYVPYNNNSVLFEGLKICLTPTKEENTD